MDQPVNHFLHVKIKTLDGFRGLAVILVCCYHYLHFFSFGWTGVDLFFILSGFLITGKLIESIDSNHYFRSFYLKRILRIVPLYFSVLLIFFVIIPLLLPSFVSVSFKELLQQQIYYWTFTANLYDAVHGWPLNITLIHFWSLACEMQFYLVWPFIVYFFYGKRKSMVIILIALCLSGLLFRIYGHFFLVFSSIYRYVLMPCRLDAFCAGALLYMFVSRNKIILYKKIFLSVSLLALGSILLIMAIMQVPWHFSADTVSKYGYTLDAIFWSTFIAFTLCSDTHLLQRIFTGSLITWFGKYSYGIYIFHLPVFVIISRQHLLNAGSQDKTWSLAAIAFITTCLCSFASYHLLEKHFLKLKPVR
ncbi:MAG: acyltransferase [Bacteroidota bacterium]